MLVAKPARRIGGQPLGNDAFITNGTDSNLSKRLNELVLHSDRLSFLSGFFYFSGAQEIYSALKNNPRATMRVLVGLQADLISTSL
ncbi:MAG: hypothetical protein RLZZ212_493, partial [Actinomycetota bacterium]